MGTLPELPPGSDCPITVSGELEDGQRFRGTTDIALTSWSRRLNWNSRFPGRLPHGMIMKQWWNR